jgi:hypothetical protein
MRETPAKSAAALAAFCGSGALAATMHCNRAGHPDGHKGGAPIEDSFSGTMSLNPSAASCVLQPDPIRMAGT